MPKQKNTVIEYRRYDLPMVFPVLLLHGDNWRISDIKSGRLHFHNCLEIGYCHSDSGTMEFENTRTQFKAGDITYVPANLPHTTYSSPGTESLWSYFYVDFEKLFQGFFHSAVYSGLSSDALLRTTYSIFDQEEYPQIQGLVHMIIETMLQREPNYQANITCLVLSLLIETINAQNASLSVNKGDTAVISELAIAPALDFINQNYMQQFSIEDLADLCHLSVTHFRRLFGSIMGTPPLDFVNNVRIEKACVMLRSTEDSVLEVSERVGFHSISSFNRYFSKIMNATPRDWRSRQMQVDTIAGRKAIVTYAGWFAPERPGQK